MMVDEPKKRGATRQAKVLLVDDHPIVRQGLAELIEQEADLTICGQAQNASQALQAAASLHPDIAIVDISLQGLSGIELTKDLKAQHPGVAVLVLSMHDETLYAERVLRAGARGYIMKEEAAEKVMTAIREVLAGKLYLSEEMSSRLLSKFLDGGAKIGSSPEEQLTDRELQVFELIGHGRSTREIAETLHRSIKTIESHREHIKSKLKLTGSTDLVRHAVQWIHST